MRGNDSMGLKSFKDLMVWRRSIELVTEIYRITKELPASEAYGLSSQMRRAAVSIPSNIAEGYKRKGRAEYLQFLCIAEASAAELETQIIILKKVYPEIPVGDVDPILLEVQKMLYKLINSLSPTPYTPTPNPSSS